MVNSYRSPVRKTYTEDKRLVTPILPFLPGFERLWVNTTLWILLAWRMYGTWITHRKFDSVRISVLRSDPSSTKIHLKHYEGVSKSLSVKCLGESCKQSRKQSRIRSYAWLSPRQLIYKTRGENLPKTFFFCAAPLKPWTHIYNSYSAKKFRRAIS